MKNKKRHHIFTGNQAAAHIAYRTNEVFPIYPITPSSEMSALVEEWCANQQPTIFGTRPSAFEMQSEAGVAGAMHGALQTGALSTTFTASQGLLLMQPNMYKIAGELTPNVIHVATRSIATHSLSVFGDHSDIMAVRNTGYAFLGAASVQETMDFALIAQAATLKSRIPFVHFFDGFRTSHETNSIEIISDEIIKAMIDTNLVEAHRNRALNPKNPVLRGTSQEADVFFQSREAINSFYDACPDIVQDEMNTFSKLTGRQYKLFDYVGHPQAEQVLIAMASATETIEETINHLNTAGEKIGLIKVRLFRPFSTEHLIEALPSTCKSIAVLDRTKEPGATGEPLYLDVVQSLTHAKDNNNFKRFPKIIGGRYGLSSKELTPNMVNAIITNLKEDRPRHNFTIGIKDDVTNLSLDYPTDILFESLQYQAIFYQVKSEKTSANFSNVLGLLGISNCVQGYSECDSKKSGSRYVSHIRIGSQVIKAPYLIEDANFITCDNISFLENDNPLKRLKAGGVLLVNTPLSSDSFWVSLSANKQSQIIEKNIVLYIVDTNKLEKRYNLKERIISALQASFLSLKSDLIDIESFSDIKHHIIKIDTSKARNTEVNNIDPDFAQTLLGKLLEGKGNELPVSAMPVDGTFETNTAQFNIAKTGSELPEWNPELCTQCGACSMACPQGVLRIKAYDDTYLEKAPSDFKSVKALEEDWEIDLLNYTVQADPEQCTSCNNCVDACPVKALSMVERSGIQKREEKNWSHFEKIPEFDRSKIDITKVSQQQLQEPLFKYSIGVEGCGEAPYLKLLSQLFGDRMLVANATGASSIFGGALPTTPWSKNAKGQGPAWSNSLFEDNAEFGLGYKLALDQRQQLSKNINSPQNETVWIVGGDGWAYDIGYGGLDHVIGSGKNVNILVLDNEVYDNTGGQASKATPYGAEAAFAFGGRQKQKKDLGLLAMCYDDVYVASVAIGADQEQTLKAFTEAESYEGPSIIIAYCHSSSHGIDMKNPSQYQKAAVDSGQWLLYRNDPRREEEGLNTLQLDSKEPSIKIEEYLIKEQRFTKLFERDQVQFNRLMEKIQAQIYKRFNKYEFLASSRTINAQKVSFESKI